MLLQETRIIQSLEEKGLSCPYTFCHSTPWVKIGDKNYILIFLQYIFNYINKKTIDTLFIGLITEKRKQFLNKFPTGTLMK